MKVFFSYAHADNNALEQVTHFFKLFNDRLHQLGRAELEPFIDGASLRQMGVLEERLDAAVRQCDFLFVFIGPAYIGSDRRYCVLEWKSFWNKHGDTAKDRIIVIELEQVSLDEIVDERGDRIRALITIPLYEEDKWGTKRPIPPKIGENNNARFVVEVHKAADLFIEASANLKPPPPPPEAWDVLIAAATADLDREIQTLERELTSRSLSHQRVEGRALLRGLEDYKKEFKAARILIIPFTMAEVARPHILGGHLAEQTSLFGPDRPVIWWFRSNLPGAREETQPAQLEYLKNRTKEAKRFTAANLADEVRLLLNGHESSAPRKRATIILEAAKKKTSDNALDVTTTSTLYQDVEQAINAVAEYIEEEEWKYDDMRLSTRVFCFADAFKEIDKLLKSAAQSEVMTVGRPHGLVTLEADKSISECNALLDLVENQADTLGIQVELRFLALNAPGRLVKPKPLLCEVPPKDPGKRARFDPEDRLKVFLSAVYDLASQSAAIDEAVPSLT